MTTQSSAIFISCQTWIDPLEAKACREYVEGFGLTDHQTWETGNNMTYLTVKTCFRAEVFNCEVGLSA